MLGSPPNALCRKQRARHKAIAFSMNLGSAISFEFGDVEAMLNECECV